MINPYHMHFKKAPIAPIAGTPFARKPIACKPFVRTGLSFMSHVIVYHMAR